MYSEVSSKTEDIYFYYHEQLKLQANNCAVTDVYRSGVQGRCNRHQHSAPAATMYSCSGKVGRWAGGQVGEMQSRSTLTEAPIQLMPVGDDQQQPAGTWPWTKLGESLQKNCLHDCRFVASPTSQHHSISSTCSFYEPAVIGVTACLTLLPFRWSYYLSVGSIQHQSIAHSSCLGPLDASIPNPESSFDEVISTVPRLRSADVWT